MSGKDLLHPETRGRGGDKPMLTPAAAIARDQAQWLEDREAPSVQNRELARRNLEHRHGVPRGVFWGARHRARNTLGDWLDPLLAARAEVLRGEVDEFETALVAARALDRGDLAGAIREAEAAVADAKARLAALTPKTRAAAGAAPGPRP